MSQMYVVECVLDKEPRARKHRVARWIVTAIGESVAIVKAAVASYKETFPDESPDDADIANELSHGIWSAKPVGNAMRLETVSR